MHIFYKTDAPEHVNMHTFYKTDSPEHVNMHTFYKTDAPEHVNMHTFYKTDTLGDSKTLILLRFWVTRDFPMHSLSRLFNVFVSPDSQKLLTPTPFNDFDPGRSPLGMLARPPLWCLLCPFF